MLKRSNKIVFMVIAILCFSSCKNLNFVNAYKKTHISGLPNQNNYKVYTIKVKGKSDFKINSIHLTINDNDIKIKKYSFINLKDFKGHTVLDNLKIYEKGNYEFSFRVDIDENMSNENIKLEYVVDNKFKTLKVTPIKKKKTFDK